MSDPRLDMPVQNLSRPFRDPAAPPRDPKRDRAAMLGARLAVGLPALLTTGLLLAAVLDWFNEGGFAVAEIAMAGLMAFTFFWIALSVSTATLGLFAELSRTKPRADAADRAGGPLKVAVILPVYHEDPARTFASAQAMMGDLVGSRHDYALRVLSDTRGADAHVERAAFEAAALGDAVYRNRAVNAGKKAGNIAEWVMREGGAFDAMLVLDADSLMTGETIDALADAMAADAGAGLIQTVPRILDARSLFARAQQFACDVYGPALARGLARWTGDAGNYWGHNAIIRTRAFAACCGLPDLAGRGPLSGLILSHDFVEAALLRRAGWGVRVMADETGTYEETPPTLIDHALRDRRWCQGNLQHLRLLFTAGLHPLSRFHLLQGAMSYLTSVAWFALLVLWAVLGVMDGPATLYFSPENPLFPVWPEIDLISRALVLCFVYAMLLAPKAMGLLGLMIDDPTLATVGGRRRLAGSALVELGVSVLLAPIMMVQQVRAVLSVLLGVDAGWAPQKRDGGRHGWGALLRFHAVETALGVLLTVGVLLGVATAWIAPIAFSLVLAAPISRILERNAPRLLPVPENYAPPRVLTRRDALLGCAPRHDAPGAARHADEPLSGWRPLRP